MRVLTGAASVLLICLAVCAVPSIAHAAAPWDYVSDTDEEAGTANLIAEIATPGTPDPDRAPLLGLPDRTSSEPERRWTPPPIVRGNGCGVTPDNSAAVECTGTLTPAPPPADAPAGTPGITIRDVASFRPELAVLRSEPDGWAVRGLDANILATGGSSIRTGELFGVTAEVRFTPVAYTFDYGDGSAPLNTATPGATWEALGLAEFDPTATSHVYDSAGTYTVTLLVDYAAEYRVGGGDYILIPGTLAIPSTPIQIVVADSATTALVDRSCRADPSGPGC